MKRIVLMAAAILLSSFGGLSAAEYVVTQNDRKFVPNELRVKVGDSITFVNEEKRRRHNVYANTARFDYVTIRKQKPGDRDSVVIKHAGTIDIRCALHPKMKMRIYVSK